MQKIARVAQMTVVDSVTQEVTVLKAVERVSIFTRQFEIVASNPYAIKALRDLPEITLEEIIKVALIRHLWWNWADFGLEDDIPTRYLTVTSFVVDFVEERHWTEIPRKTKYHDSHNHKLCADYIYDVMHG